MDPINPGSEQYGHDTEGEDARPALGAALPERSPAAPARARVVRLVSGELLLTVNPVDGSEIEPCPPGQEPEAPRRRTPVYSWSNVVTRDFRSMARPPAAENGRKASSKY
ncbi:hypothetical protein AB0B13_15155, partial [Streptomyces sp. NPDC042898]|uniref:hypothetical protein n=1 Tax=Streptomyces sp. NPDC042898 TaxID=3154334 RepID=UPI0033DAF290